MTAFTAVQLLIGIISCVEAGLTTPEEAVTEWEGLKKQAPEGFNPGNYSVEDFQRIRTAYLSKYGENTEYIDNIVGEFNDFA